MISLQKFFGKDDKFYDLLEASAGEARNSVSALNKILRNPKSMPSLDEFAAARRKDKQITNEIAEHLVKTFVTDLEREDIEALSNVLYKIPKTVEKFAERFIICASLVRETDFTRHAVLLEQATEHVVAIVKDLRGGLHLEEVKEHNEKLQQIEGEADELILDLLKDLYSGKHDPMKAMALKDLYELLEKVVDRCRDAGNVVSHIVLKNS
jgi:uncharacterized protein Yka (UPF0111/DUF47 family)